MKYLELIAVVFGIISVWYARKEDIKVFPFGIAGVLIFVYIFFVGKMYANAGINMVYSLTNAFGWYNWSRKKEDENVVKITRNTSKQNAFTVVFAIVFYVVVLMLLRWLNREDLDYLASPTPWMDALNSSIFMCATVLMTIKKLENWHFWILGNIISIPIFVVQGYYFVTFQYVVFLVLAISGLKEWKKKISDNE